MNINNKLEMVLQKIKFNPFMIFKKANELLKKFENISSKPTLYEIVKTETFLLKSGPRQAYLLSSVLFNSILEVPPRQ